MLTVWEARSCGVGLPLKKLVRDTSLTEWVPVLQGDPTPPRWRPLSPLEEGHLRRQAADWLAKGVVEKTRPLPWVNNPVFVEKKNGNIRTCIDCRPVNAVTGLRLAPTATAGPATPAARSALVCPYGSQ